ncbi:hypothetical protein BT93_B1027 [Corymbia citriodora subsp. variegata]|nr:hypothetical protein BT93_B1027 [Corymbia citriodora subsp. variegata]
MGNGRFAKAEFPPEANAIARLNKQHIADLKKGGRHLRHVSLCSSIAVAGTETKLVYLKYVGRENNLPDPIHLRVQNQEGDDVVYLLDRSVPLKALMDHYCARRGLPYGTVRFSYDGAKVPESKSAEDLGMNNRDVIDAWVDKLGG